MSDKYERIAELYARRLSGDSKIAAIKTELMDLAYDQGYTLHAEYLKTQQALGYTFDPENANDDPAKGPLTDPETISFDLLEDWRQDCWMAGTDIARKLYTTAHKNVSKYVNTLLCTIAEDVHNAYVTDMLQDGWAYGDKYDEEAEISPCLLPFNVLLNDPELKSYADYAIAVARELMSNLVDHAECVLPAGGIQKKITDILSGQ